MNDPTSQHERRPRSICAAGNDGPRLSWRLVLILTLFLFPAATLTAQTVTREVARPAAAIPVPPADAPFLDYSSAWPARVGLSASRALVRDLPREPWSFVHLRFGPLVAQDVDNADANDLLASFAVANDSPRPQVAFEDHGAFLVRFQEAKQGSLSRRTVGTDHFVVLSAEDGGSDHKGLIDLQRTWFVLYEPLKTGDAPQGDRGVVLFMPGIFGTPEGTIESLIKSLRHRGYWVLRMIAQPSRFTQRVTFKVDPREPDAAGAAIARVLTDRAAECAFAVEAAFRHAIAKHADLATLPRVAIGFSGGAMTLPTVVARDSDAYKAAILVGGGCQFWLVNAHSTYAEMISAIGIEWIGREPTESDREEVARAYLRHAPLDSYHTAAALRGKPVLLIQANADSAVPSALGDLLWERLGKPDRWIRSGEHLPLFMNLPKDSDSIGDWLEQHALKRQASPEGGQGGADRRPPR